MAVTKANPPAAIVPDSNEQRRADALERKIGRQHRWRLQVWAQCELRIREMQSDRQQLGAVEIDVSGPDFSALSPEELQGLAQAGSDD